MAIEAPQNERDSKAERKAQLVAKSASDSGDLAETTATRDEDEKYLTELTAQCAQKSNDFEALQKAMDIISDGAVSGAADKHLPKLLQTSFLQLRANSGLQKRAKVVLMLQERAESSR